MYIQQALTSLVGAPHLLAFRVGGPILTVTKRFQVVDSRGKIPRRFSGCLDDFLAIDWQVIERAQFAQILQKMRDERAQRAAQDEGGGNGG